MVALARAVRRAAGVVLPRHRRWKRLIAGLQLDPDRLPLPLEEPGDGDFIICGCSRTGTSLLSAMLFQPPSVVTVMEPWDGMRLAPAPLFRSLREQIDKEGTLTGRLDLAALEQGEVLWASERKAAVPVRVAERFLLGVKWPIFWRYLDHLPHTRFLVCIRNPVEVIGSFRRTGGRLAQGLDYDVAFNRRMNEELSAATGDASRRRVLLYDYVNSRLLAHLQRPNVFVVRYERWFQDPGGLLAEIGRFLGVELKQGQVDIRPPRPKPIDPGELRLIRELCRTAEALGYSV
ncbi:MAG: sulfotransferase [Actinomycetota bacterium]|nr:sulfotransferase [Actinomycetota bacterium]